MQLREARPPGAKQRAFPDTPTCRCGSTRGRRQINTPPAPGPIPFFRRRSEPREKKALPIGRLPDPSIRREPSSPRVGHGIRPASSCPITRLCSSSERCSSFWISPSRSFDRGMPVHRLTTCAISSSVTSSFSSVVSRLANSSCFSRPVNLPYFLAPPPCS